MADPITIIVLLKYGVPTAIGLGTAAYLAYKDYQENNSKNKNKRRTSARITELDDLQEKRQQEREHKLRREVDEAEGIREELHQDGKKNIANIQNTRDTISKTTSIVSEQRERLVQIRKGIAEDIAKQKEAFGKREKELLQKISQLEKANEELMVFKESHKELEVLKKDLQKLSADKSELIDLEKKLSEQINALKEIIHKQDTQMQKKDSLLSNQNRLLRELEKEVEELQAFKERNVTTSRPRFFSQP